MVERRKTEQNQSFDKSYIKKQFTAMLKYVAIYIVALIYWEILLRTQTGFDSISFYFLLFLPAEATFLTLLTGWLKPKLNRVTTPVVLVLPFAFYVSQLIYFRIFGSVFSVSMMGMGADAVENFGWALWSTIKDSVGWIFLCLLPVLAAVVLSLFAPKGFFRRLHPLTHLASLLNTVVLWLLAVLLLLPFGKGDGSAFAAYSSPYIDSDTASGRLGVLTNSIVELGYKLFGSSAKPNESDDLMYIPETPDLPLTDHTPDTDTTPNIINGIDFETLKGLTDDKDKQELCDYFAGVSATNKNEYTGLLKDYNLIYICAESFSQYAIDPVVTPTLYKLSQGGFVLNNYYNSYKNTTTNGEFSFMTGLWPDVSRDADAGTDAGSFPQSATKYLPFALGNSFENVGVKTYAYHNYKGTYYSRNKTHPNLGYTSLRFMDGENRMTFTGSWWPSSDLEMMEQSIGDYINNEQFHAYYMTFSGHGPYSEENGIAKRNYETVKELLGDRELKEKAIYYLAANYELEKAMTYLVEKLEEAGKLDKTMIVITGDHYPYYLDSQSLNSIAGHKVDQTFEKYESTCIMWCGGMETVQVDTYCCNVDILPTVLNLFGLEYDSRLLPGVDIFSDNIHIATLYNKSFVTDMVKYNADKNKAEWLEAADSLSDEQKQQYLDYCIAATKSRYAASLKTMDEDFFKFVFDNITPATP